VSERLSATRSTCVSLPSSPDSRRSPLDHRLPLNHRRKIPANESPSFPPSQPPAFPFFSYILSPFLHTSGNDDKHLAAAARHQYAPNTILSVFLSILLTFHFTFSCSSGATTTRIPTLLRHRSFLATGLDYPVGILMQLSSLLAHRGWHRSCVNQSFGVSLLSRVRFRHPVISAIALLGPLPTTCFTSRLSSLPSCVPQISPITLLLGRHTLSQSLTKLHRSWRLSAHHLD